MSVRAKMRITSVTMSKQPGPNGAKTGEVRMYAVADKDTPENERYHRYTPSAQVQISIDNPPAFAFFEERLGDCVYVDFTPAPE